MKKFTTTRKSLGFKALVCFSDGRTTGYNLMVPYDSPQTFCLGHLEFDVKQSPTGKHFAYAKGAIPTTWLVDLNGVV